MLGRSTVATNDNSHLVVGNRDCSLVPRGTGVREVQHKTAAFSSPSAVLLWAQSYAFSASPMVSVGGHLYLPET